jgi:hypothetical protein
MAVVGVILLIAGLAVFVPDSSERKAMVDKYDQAVTVRI